MRFDTTFVPHYGEAIEVAARVLHATAPNASAFTFHGTNSYIVGEDTLCIIDPGPDDESHFRTLLGAIRGRPVSHILITHTHRDHSPLARRLAQATGATVLGEGAHRAAREIRLGEGQRLDASGDLEFKPDRAVKDQELIEGDGWALRAVFTPGHAANHMAYALDGTGILFSGDHVMGWATTIVAPPDGSMRDYMASLDRLLERDDRMYLPGHGGAVRNPAAFVRGLRAHRRMRERAILERVVHGDRRIPEIVEAIYRGTDPRLHGAAGLSVFAHLEDLVARGVVATDGVPMLEGEFRPA